MKIFVEWDRWKELTEIGKKSARGRPGEYPKRVLRTGGDGMQADMDSAGESVSTQRI